MYDFLIKHVGHKVEVVKYGEENVSIECVDCNEVLVSKDKGLESEEDKKAKKDVLDQLQRWDEDSEMFPMWM